MSNKPERLVLIKKRNKDFSIEGLKVFTNKKCSLCDNQDKNSYSVEIKNLFICQDCLRTLAETVAKIKINDIESFLLSFRED